MDVVGHTVPVYVCVCGVVCVGGRCQAVPDNVHQLHVQQPSTYANPEADSAVLSSS